MSRLSNFIKGITSPFVDDPEPDTARERRRRVRQRRRERFNSPDRVDKGERGKSRKDEDGGGINRRVTVNEQVRETIGGNVRTKPYDSVFLRDLSANAVVQAYIDTLSQDVAGANWAIKPRDEDADISDEALAKVERRIKQLPPGNQTFRDVLESTTRVLLELGDATIVKHYYDNKPDRVAELVPVDSASVFKKVDKHGIVEGYVQVSRRGGQKTDEFDTDDVVWVEWSSRPDRFYGQGPLEKAQNEVELLEELAEKERLDLIQGGPPGVVSPEVLDDYGGLPNDEDWETFVENMRLDEGERHRVGYSKTPVNFEPINHNYQELQILDRSKYWVTVLGSVFKVNPTYAGFDFENVNRATDESQQAAYQQRGFRVTLRQLEEAINRGLIWSEYSTDIKFEFEQEQTVEERKDRAQLVEEQAQAGKEMANAGRDVSFRDGRLVVEDGPIEEGDVGGGGGGGGGLFGSVDDPDDADLAVESRKEDVGDSGNGDGGERLTKEQVAKLDGVLLRAYKRQIFPPSLDAIEKRSWSSDEDVPQFVIDKIQEVVDRGAVFENFESLPGRVADVIENTLKDALTQPQGWSLDSIVDNMSSELPRADPDDLETIARTESAKVLNEAREEGYQDRGLDDAKFKWQGPSDSRTTELCEELKNRTNPSYGGDPVPLPELVSIERSLSDQYFPDLKFRKHVPHINCRHTFVRATGTGTDDVDVDVPSAEEMGERFEEGDVPVSPQDFGPEYDAKSVDGVECDHDRTYDDVLTSVAKATNVTRRVGEIEDALGSPLPVVLRECLEEAGSTRGAHKELNRRLAEADDWDVDEDGKVSTATIYEWASRYDGHVGHLT